MLVLSVVLACSTIGLAVRQGALPEVLVRFPPNTRFQFILRIGSDHDQVTFLHYAEHIVDIPNKTVAKYKVPVLENGERVDVTRLAQFKAPAELATVSPRGQVRPVADGAGQIQFQVLGQSGSIPVQVAGQ